jgi:ribosomal protein S18 acetylase RimI-like enzyme
MLPSGQVFMAHNSGSILGVAAWLPPEPVAPDAAATRRQMAFDEAVLEAYPETATALFEGFEKLGHSHPAAPHWYLAFVGVEPRMQSSGIGEQLLSGVLRSADEGGACVLSRDTLP